MVSVPARSVLRHEIMEHLKQATSAVGRVYMTRSTPVPKDSFPCLLVYFNREELVGEECDQIGSTVRRVELAIEGAVSGINLEDQLDILADEVEQAMAGFVPKLSLLRECNLEEISFFVYVEESPVIGVVAMTYVVLYIN